MERDRWGRGENANFGERIAVLETKFAALQDAIDTLNRGQLANRAYSEKSFNEVLTAQGELKQEIADLKIVVAAKATPILDSSRLYTGVILIGVGIAVLAVLLLMLWVRLGSPS